MKTINVSEIMKIAAQSGITKGGVQDDLTFFESSGAIDSERAAASMRALLSILTAAEMAP